MSEKELKQIRTNILKEQKKVASSKSEATKYLIQLGVLTKSGNVKKAFKALQ
jgi:hypothetical protein